MNNLDMLLRAVVKIRETADAAYRAPWRQDDCHVWTDAHTDPDEGPTVYVNGGVHRNQANTAKHIAMWSPAAARVVADILDETAMSLRHEQFPDDPNVLASYESDLELARLILGEDL